jgi:hypothetical protein
VSDHGGGRQKYKGITGGLRCSWDEYLRTMLDGQPQLYEIRYKLAPQTRPPCWTSEALHGPVRD